MTGSLTRSKVQWDQAATARIYSRTKTGLDQGLCARLRCQQLPPRHPLYRPTGLPTRIASAISEIADAGEPDTDLPIDQQRPSRSSLITWPQPDVIEALRAGEQDGNRELSEVLDRLVAVRARHEQLADAVAAGTVSVATLVRAEPPLLAEIATLEARERELSTPSVLRGLIEPGTDIAERWASTPMSIRREVARLLLTPDLIGQLRLGSRPRRRRVRTPAHERTQ